MSSRFEAPLPEYLVGLFQQSLGELLAERGFQQTLHVPEPDVRQFQREGTVVTMEISNPRSHRRTVVVESEEMDVTPLVALAARSSVGEVAEELMTCVQSVDQEAARRRVEECLLEMIPDA